MRYFDYKNRESFYKEPTYFDKYTGQDVLKYAIGANMYMPSTKEDIAEKIMNRGFGNVGAITLCLEDAIPAHRVKEGEDNILNVLEMLNNNERKEGITEEPLIFIRVRSVEQFKKFSKRLKPEHLENLAGFNFPKFDSTNGWDYFSILDSLSKKTGAVLYGMPILESEKLIYKETRTSELEAIQKILVRFKEYVLNIRVGGTDFSSIYGLRRRVTTSIYDVKVVSDCLTDIINFFLRQDIGYVVSGPVWEYFSSEPDSEELKGLRREIELDIQNGFHGKTIIHPTQIDVVNETYIVNYDDYMDALHILGSTGGVFKSNAGNRMNETKPHTNWAKKVLAKAEIFGVEAKRV